MNKAIEKLMNDYPNQVHFSTSEIKKAAKDIGENPRSAYTFIKYRENCPQISRGVYDLTSLMPKSATPKKDAAMSYASTTAVASVSNDEVFVPNFDDTFVAWDQECFIQHLFLDFLEMVKHL
jgi:hypothetical protein